MYGNGTSITAGTTTRVESSGKLFNAINTLNIKVNCQKKTCMSPSGTLTTHCICEIAVILGDKFIKNVKIRI